MTKKSNLLEINCGDLSVTLSLTFSDAVGHTWPRDSHN